jgi:myosin-crossreactive antigen
MAEIAAKHRPAVKTPTAHRRATPEDRLAGVVDRSAELSDAVVKSLETSERAALEAVGQFVITIEEALPQEVASTSDVAKKITESGFEMADRLVHTMNDFVRKVIDSAAKSLSSRDGAKPHAV